MHKNFTHNVKVYYEDTDAGGVVYYANYLKYLERARTEALSTIGLSNIKIKNDFGALIIVKSCNIEYKKSAYLEDDLQIKSFVDSTSKTSFLMNQLIFKPVVNSQRVGYISTNSAIEFVLTFTGKFGALIIIGT